MIENSLNYFERVSIYIKLLLFKVRLKSKESNKHTIDGKNLELITVVKFGFILESSQKGTDQLLNLHPND